METSVLCAIHQPQYLPWLGYLSKLDDAELFVLYDDTDYKHDEWQNRNRIKLPGAAWQWLTVPVHHSKNELIRDIRIDNSKPWRRKHLHAIDTNYGSAPFFETCRHEFAALYHQDWDYLAHLNAAVLKLLCRLFAITTPTVLSSTLHYSGRATDALISICREVGADRYLSGPGARAYLRTQDFAAAGIELLFHDYEHPVYTQTGNGPRFVSGMAAIDLLFNCGPSSTALLRSGRRTTAHPQHSEKTT